MNKLRKTFIRSGMSLMMAMSLLFSVSISASARTYEDVVYYTTEYKDAISFVADNGYMIGTGETTFVPDEMMTRAMLITVLYNIEGKPKHSIDIPFTDVVSGDWFYNAVCWAYDVGLVVGNGAGQFSPHNHILKQDAIQILYKYAVMKGVEIEQLPDEVLAAYTDSGNISNYARNAVK